VRCTIGGNVTGRIYFPLEGAWTIKNEVPKKEWRKDAKYKIVAKCTSVDRMSSKATAEASILTLDGISNNNKKRKS
jgi:hypothetical protein